METHIDIATPPVVPDLDRLVSAVHERSPKSASYIHGDQHWRAVAEMGLKLLPLEPKADPIVVYLFAMFHDSMRVNENEDPGHGQRGADLAEEFAGDYFQLAPERLGLLLQACAGHTEIRYSDDPTIGVCLDADRLNLWRVGITPEAKFLSTEVVLDDQLYESSRSLHGRARDWEALLRAYNA